MTLRDPHRLWVALAIVALVLVAFVERWSGLGFLLPHEREADTAIVHVAAFHDRPAGTGATDAAYPSTVYPLFFPKVLVLLPGSNWPQAASADAPLEAHLEAAAEPYLRARRLMALLSLLIIPCTYWLARKWLEPWWSVLAAGLATTSLLVLELSQLAKPHGGLAGLNALAFVGMLALLRSGSLLTYVGAGVTTGLALASLNSGCFVAPSLALAHWLAWRKDRNGRRWIGFAIAVAICAAFFVVAYPYMIFGDPLQSTSKDTFNFGQQAIYWDTWGFQGFLDMTPWMWANDPTLVVLVALGIVALVVGLARGKVARASALRPETLVVGLHVLITVMLFGLHERFYPRYFIPIIPVFCIVGAGALRAVGSLVRPAQARRAVSVALGLMALAFPAYATAWFAILRAREDTETLAVRWLEANVPPDASTIALDFSLSLPLLQRRDAIRESPDWSWKPWQRYQMEIMPPQVRGTQWNLRPIFEPGVMVDRRIDRAEARARLAKLDAQWAIVSVLAASDAKSDETRLAVRELAGEPVVRILPYRPSGADEPLSTRDMDPDFLAHMLAKQRLGPAIEIYKLR